MTIKKVGRKPHTGYFEERDRQRCRYFFAPDKESSVPGIFSDEARCSLFIKSGGKTGAFCFGRGRFRQTARQFFGLPITCRLCPREIIMQAAVPADKVAPNRLSCARLEQTV